MFPRSSTNCYRYHDPKAIEGAKPQERVVTPYVEPVLPGRPTADARTSVVRYEGKNIFARTLLHITDWIHSRVATARINNALMPFIKSVTRKGAQEPNEQQFRALNDALKSATAVQHGSEELVHEVICLSLAKLDRDEKIGLSEKLAGVEGCFTERTREGLLFATYDSLAKSTSQNADYYAMEALNTVAVGISEGRTVPNLIKASSPYLVAYLNSFSADKKSADAVPPLPDPIRQLKLISSCQASTVTKWFEMQSPEAQKQLAKKIHGIATDKSLLEKSADVSTMRFVAFCKRIAEVLPQPVRYRP